jgi:hypothetical protein
MREHKYRGLTKEGKEVKGSLIQSKDCQKAYIGYAEYSNDGVSVIYYEEVLPESVGMEQLDKLEALVDKLVESLREIKRHETECLQHSCGYDGMVDGVAEDALAEAKKFLDTPEKEQINSKG